MILHDKNITDNIEKQRPNPTFNKSMCYINLDNNDATADALQTLLNFSETARGREFLRQSSLVGILVCVMIG